MKGNPYAFYKGDENYTRAWLRGLLSIRPCGISLDKCKKNRKRSCGFYHPKAL
ncbi:hypothetical protein ACRE1S_03220 [Helicobacter himalayensis]|uniref:hypothetical protein n=1 Tax=Helicobacter himalayensis TaxID=1591088 RepID=UPI003D6EEAED